MRMCLFPIPCDKANLPDLTQHLQFIALSDLCYALCMLHKRDAILLFVRIYDEWYL